MVVAPLEGSVNVFTLIFIVLAVVLGVILFRWFWNDTMPEVFGLKRITYWQALRLLIIAALVLNLGMG